MATSRRQHFPLSFHLHSFHLHHEPHFNTTVRWISHSHQSHTPQGAHPNIVILLRMEDKAFPKTTCSGPARFPSNSSLPERLSLKPSSLNQSSSTTTTLFLPNELLDQLVQDPALNYMDILAIRSICRTLLPVRNKRIHPPPLHILRGTEIIIVLESQR